MYRLACFILSLIIVLQTIFYSYRVNEISRELLTAEYCAAYENVNETLCNKYNKKDKANGHY